MFIDHTGAVFPEHFGLGFRVVGRLAFPIFVFLLAEGFRHTRNPYNFLARLGVFAIVSEPFFDLALHTTLHGHETFSFRFLLDNVNFLSSTNIFYTLFFGGVAIMAYRYIISQKDAIFNMRETAKYPSGRVGIFGKTSVAILFLVASFAFAELLTTDYASYGVLFILLMYAVKTKKTRLAVMAFMCLWQHTNILAFIFDGYGAYLPFMFLLMIPATVFTVFLVMFYNGKRGPGGMKMLFYVLYPAHLGVLFAIAMWWS